MDFDGECSGFAPALVSLTPFTPTVSPSTRRLSSCFTRSSTPAVRAKRQLAWVSLQGRLVGAEEATTAATIDTNGLLGAKEAVAWELFTPIQRVLTVAVVAAAAANSIKNKRISHLQKSVEVRDQVLLGMQQKLDNLCDQLSYSKEHPAVVTLGDAFVAKNFDSGCQPCQHHNLPLNGSSLHDSTTKELNSDEGFKYKMPISNLAEPEERRMSDLSDWAPSVTSSVDIQLDSLSIEHEIDSLRKECEEKDVAITKLSTYIQSSEVLGSKRIVELEDLIRRKNMIINKLRKDVVVLEQKVTNLTRLRRKSFPAAISNLQRFPPLTDNVLYDMDSTTGASSSDSDYSPRNKGHALFLKIVGIPAGEASTYEQDCKSHPVVVPGNAKSTNVVSNTGPGSRTRRTMKYASGENQTRRVHLPKPSDVGVLRRWA